MVRFYCKEGDFLTDYCDLNRKLTALIENVPHQIANLANASALLFEELEELNWAGFYLWNGEKLVLGPFQGRPACIEILMGRGVCGTAAERKQTVLVPNVHEFPGHIACDGASNSEIVVPIFDGETLFGVLDLDSPKLKRFSEEDQAGLEKFVHILERELFQK